METFRLQCITEGQGRLPPLKALMSSVSLKGRADYPLLRHSCQVKLSHLFNIQHMYMRFFIRTYIIHSCTELYISIHIFILHINNSHTSINCWGHTAISCFLHMSPTTVCIVQKKCCDLQGE